MEEMIHTTETIVEETTEVVQQIPQTIEVVQEVVSLEQVEELLLAISTSTDRVLVTLLLIVGVLSVIGVCLSLTIILRLAQDLQPLEQLLSSVESVVLLL